MVREGKSVRREVIGKLMWQESPVYSTSNNQVTCLKINYNAMELVNNRDKIDKFQIKF